MKRLLIFVLALRCLALTTASLAHSGRTDSDGGHWDTSTGEYHYHHGHPAHHHIGGVCPYGDYYSTDYSGYESDTTSDYINEHKGEHASDTTTSSKITALYNETKRLNGVIEQVQWEKNVAQTECERWKQNYTSLAGYAETNRQLAIWLSVALGITLIVCIATNVSKSKKIREQARK